MNYDLLIIGNEREGIEQAISAAQNGDRVAVVGGTQTAPSIELMRRAANAILERREISIQSWRAELRRLMDCQAAADRAEMECLGIDWIPGDATFISPNVVQVTNQDHELIVSSDKLIIATGTKSWCPKSFYRDDRFVLSVESLFNLDQLPASTIVVGAGRVGMALANILASLGVEVIVVDEDFCLSEISGIGGLQVEASQTFDIAFRLGDEVIGTELRGNMKAAVRFANGRTLEADTVLLCTGRQGTTEDLELEIAGVGVDERGRIWCDLSGKTWASHIAAAGDVMGDRRTTDRRASEINRIGSSFSKGFSTAAKSVETAIGLNRA